MTVDFGRLLFFYLTGFEGRAVQSNSPVDCCDRERPSDRSRANRIPCSPPEPHRSNSFCGVFLMLSTTAKYTQNPLSTTKRRRHTEHKYPHGRQEYPSPSAREVFIVDFLMWVCYNSNIF